MIDNKMNKKNLRSISYNIVSIIFLILLYPFNLSKAEQVVFPDNIVKEQPYAFPINLSSSYVIVGGSIYDINEAALFVIGEGYQLNGMDRRCLPSNLFSWTSDNRYYGLTVGKDIVIAIVNANSDSNARLSVSNGAFSYQNYTGGGNWDGQGVFTPKFSLSSNITWCSGKPFSVTKFSTINTNNEVIKGTLTGSLVLYAGPNADIGTFNVPSLYWNITLRGTTLSSAKTIRLDYPLNCSISAPATIDFKTINLTGNEKDGDILAFENGEIKLNCSSANNAATANASVAITGNKGRYTDTLALSGTSAPAEIRGIIGSPIPPTGSCSAKSDGYTNFINFSAPTPINVGKIKLGTNLIPYSFTLCSKGVYALGEATATATMDINWE